MTDLIKIETDNSGRSLVSGRELHEFLDVGRVFTSWIKGRIKKYGFVQDVDYTIIWSDIDKNSINYTGNSKQMSAKGYSADYSFTVEASTVLVDGESFNPKRVTLLEYLYKNNNFIRVKIRDVSRKEISFLSKLKEALKPFKYNVDDQKRVFDGKYRVDYYVPELNIAIEYDEDSHRNYTYEKHEGRQKEIEKELDCKLIRVTDKNSDEYNIGFILKQLSYQ